MFFSSMSGSGSGTGSYLNGSSENKNNYVNSSSGNHRSDIADNTGIRRNDIADGTDSTGSRAAGKGTSCCGGRDIDTSIIDSAIDSMMEHIDSEILRLLNEQITHEFSSAYLYLGFAARLEGLALPGAAAYYKIQADEEISHGMRIFDYLLRRGAQPELLPIPKPEQIPDTFAEIAVSALAQEQYITECIGNIYESAITYSDHKTELFLHWFINEQFEEEENARRIIDEIRYIRNCRASLLMLDKKMGGRKS